MYRSIWWRRRYYCAAADDTDNADNRRCFPVQVSHSVESVFRKAWLADNELMAVSNFAHKFLPHRL